MGHAARAGMCIPKNASHGFIGRAIQDFYAKNNIAPLKSLLPEPSSPHTFHRMPKAAQLKFKALKDFTRTRHGGDSTKGKRKLARPIATKASMHLVLRASAARGERSMLTPAHRDRVTAIIWGAAEKNHVQIEQFANSGNHLHLLVRAKTRQGFKAFLRTITGLIARVITGAVKGRAFGRFWDHLAFSRIVTPGRDYKATLAYVFQNTKEALGIPTPRKPNPNFRATLIGFS